ncbi:hypothetical protein MMC30_005352 [Trapelia coarctata]|nr:hypothetical protein [Trapelia coarctata]
MSTQAQKAQALYAPRAATYNSTWHVAHAADFINHASLSPGHHVLDLACGTGLVAIPAAAAVRPAGSVLGVDVTAEMLDIARATAKSQGADNVAFLEHDICALDGARKSLREEGYDTITCASAIPLLEDPAGAVKQWAACLKPGGRMVLDVPTETSHVSGLLFEQVAAAVGSPLPFGRLRITGKGWLEGLVREAGLEVERSFVARGYGSAGAFCGKQGGIVFDHWVQGPVGTMSGGLGRDEEKRARAREMFVEEFKGKMGEDGVVWEEDTFYVVVGRKV